MMKMKVQKAFDELGIPATVGHTSLSEGKHSSRNYDVVFCAQNFVDTFKDSAARGVTVIGMRNILSVQEAKEKIEAADIGGK